MKKVLFSLIALMGVVLSTVAEPRISFDKTSHSFGTFSQVKTPHVKCTFTFTNNGDQPLIINSAVASCGCTVPKYTKAPVKPGETGTVQVTFNADGQWPGHFKKTITVRTNGTPEMVRLAIEGDITAEK